QRALGVGDGPLVGGGGNASQPEGVLAGGGDELAALLVGEVEDQDEGGRQGQRDNRQEVATHADAAPRHASARDARNAPRPCRRWVRRNDVPRLTSAGHAGPTARPRDDEMSYGATARHRAVWPRRGENFFYQRGVRGTT